MRIPYRVSAVVFAVLTVSFFPMNALCDEPLKGEIESHSQTQSLNGGAAKGSNAGTHPLQGQVTSVAPLKGFVGATGRVLPAFKLHMTKAQLDAATAQYADDLKKFFLDVADYHHAHEALKAQIGTCTENEQQWQAKLSRDKLNLTAVVIPVGIPNIPAPPNAPAFIPPPRSCCARCLITGECGHLGTGGGPAGGGGANAADSARLRELSMDVARAQNGLRYAEQENGYTSQKAIKEAEVEQSQQNLAEKFGRLQQQYDMLKIEKSALTGVQVK